MVRLADHGHHGRCCRARLGHAACLGLRHDAISELLPYTVPGLGIAGRGACCHGGRTQDDRNPCGEFWIGDCWRWPRAGTDSVLSTTGSALGFSGHPCRGDRNLHDHLSRATIGGGSTAVHASGGRHRFDQLFPLLSAPARLRLHQSPRTGVSERGDDGRARSALPALSLLVLALCRNAIP